MSWGSNLFDKTRKVSSAVLMEVTCRFELEFQVVNLLSFPFSLTE